MRANGGRFEKGQSGNPGGRPKVHGFLQELAREHTGAAVRALVSVMQDGKTPPAARVTAAVALLDRGYDRPTQPIVTDPDDFAHMTPEELRASIEEDLALLAEETRNQNEAQPKRRSTAH